LWLLCKLSRRLISGVRFMVLEFKLILMEVRWKLRGVEGGPFISWLLSIILWVNRSEMSSCSLREDWRVDFGSVVIFVWWVKWRWHSERWVSIVDFCDVRDAYEWCASSEEIERWNLGHNSRYFLIYLLCQN
jgi:hypothetical protein